MASAELDSLLKRIQALPPSQRLRLAADLFDRGCLDIARSVAEGVVTELRSRVVVWVRLGVVPMAAGGFPGGGA